jgi:hypothetical protein
MKNHYDKKASEVGYEVGDLCWLYVPQITIGESKKFYRNYTAPYILVEQLSPVNFKIAQAHSSLVLKSPVHVNILKPYIHRSIKPPPPEDLDLVLKSSPEDTPA